MNKDFKKQTKGFNILNSRRLINELGFIESVRSTIRYIDYKNYLYQREGKYCIRNILGKKMILFTKDEGISKTLYIKGKHEIIPSNEYLKILNPNDNVLDIGSNIGYYILLSSKVIKNGHIYAVEAVKENIEISNVNCFLNDIFNVSHHNIAFSDKNGYEYFNTSEYSNCGSLFGDGEKKFKIKTITVDSFLKDKQKQPDMIKMDIEGSEVEVIEGMKKTLKSPCKLFIEVHNIRPEISHTLDTLLNNGFETKMIIPRLQKPYVPKDLIKEVMKYYNSHVIFEKK